MKAGAYNLELRRAYEEGEEEQLRILLKSGANLSKTNGWFFFQWFACWNQFWLVVESSHPSKKHEFVNWDYDIPNIWENKIHVPNHQPVYHDK